MNPDLKEIFENVNRWLQFGEAKNGVLVVFCTSISVALIQSYKDIMGCLPIEIYSCGLVIFCILAAIVGTLSFLPQVRLPWTYDRELPDQHDNIYFYGHIKKYQPDALLSLLDLRRGTSTSFTAADRDLAEQIIVNSRITWNKYINFKFGIWLAMSGLITPILAAVLYLNLNRSK